MQKERLSKTVLTTEPIENLTASTISSGGTKQPERTRFCIREDNPVLAGSMPAGRNKHLIFKKKNDNNEKSAAA
jgi:hypothetical protein